MNPQPLHSKTPTNRLRYFILAFLFSAFAVCCILVAFGLGPDRFYLSAHPVILFFICSLSIMSAIVCANMFSINSGSKVMQQLATFEMEDYTKCYQSGDEIVSINPSEIFWTKDGEDYDTLSLQSEKEAGSSSSHSYTGNNESFASKTRTFSAFHCLFSKN